MIQCFTNVVNALKLTVIFIKSMVLQEKIVPSKVTTDYPVGDISVTSFVLEALFNLYNKLGLIDFNPCNKLGLTDFNRCNKLGLIDCNLCSELGLIDIYAPG